MYEAPSDSSAVLHADPTWIAPVLSTYTSSMFTCAEESPVTLQRGAKSCHIEARCFTRPTLVRVLLPLLVVVRAPVVTHILVHVAVLREVLSHSSAVQSPVAFKRGAADRVHLYINTYVFSLMHA